MKPDVRIEVLEDGISQIVLSGELTMKYRKELRAIFSSAQLSGVAIYLDIRLPAKVDFCFLQMLHDFRRERNLDAKAVFVQTSLSETDETLVDRTGFLDLLMNHEIMEQ